MSFSAARPPVQQSLSYESMATPPSSEASRDSFNSVETGLYGLRGVVLGVVVGVALGLILNSIDLPDQAATWIGTPGRLFLRALECLVPLLVFCGLVVSMTDMSLHEHAKRIGGRTLACYLFTTSVAAAIGVAMAILFRPTFHTGEDGVAESAAPIALQCGEASGYYVTVTAEGILTCENDAALADVAYLNSTTHERYENYRKTASLFLQRDINRTYERADGALEDLTLTDAIQLQLDALVPNNITTAFANATLLSIVMFAIAFGAILARGNARGRLKTTTEVTHDLYDVFMELIGWIIKFTPIAICSLLAAAIADSQDLRVLLRSVALYCLCVICGLGVHVLVFYPLLLRTFIRNANPFDWIAKMVRAQLFALASASSAATLPIVMECIAATKLISPRLYRFVLSLGVTIGMDGAAVGTPIAVVFMAQVSGVLIGPADYLAIWLASAIGSIGVGPVPSTGLVLIMTVWKTVFPSEALPAAFAFIIATDWLVDRLHTVVNVTSDTVVCRVVAQLVGDPGEKFQEEDELPHPQIAL
ncbi:Dicarboxylate/amino acid:cation (Na or H) symporter (DAACS) family protein [Phytophthora palmivora]|uniref:Amino acid transporter n=1 Tax=Phytophthora palmivora TaxID=4796 RepID=A0A2P4YL48_9STRA|nr:Dicarboxylate/amino acid:cation (Na or H) symporter (DAACS) family protein [Phytophthora palmivora]